MSTNIIIMELGFVGKIIDALSNHNGHHDFLFDDNTVVNLEIYPNEENPCRLIEIDFTEEEDTPFLSYEMVEENYSGTVDLEDLSDAEIERVYNEFIKQY